jgi:hypothetical protein
MTTGLTVVQWADLTGRGFSPHDIGPGAPREYWDAAERLLQADLSQPPEGIRSTAGQPIWTLRRVDVRGRRLWCFVVQGRRGPFGVAGTCRFAFAAETVSALDAWTAGAALAAADQQLAAPGQDGAWFRREVPRLLGGILTRQAAIPVAGDPARTATIIPAVLRVLPERESRGWSWSTCMLQLPDSPELRVVSGAWPEDFRREEPHRADSIAQWFHRGPVREEEIGARLGDDAVRRGFEVLGHYAATGQRPGPDLLREDRTLDEMLTELGSAGHVPGWREVPTLLATPDGRRSAADRHRLVRQWAAREPAEAVGRLRDEPTGPLAEALLAGLVEAQRDTSDNVLNLPTAGPPGPTTWHRKLAALLLSAYPQPQQLRAVTADWIRPGGVLGNEQDLLAARAWLRSLGLTPKRDRAYFPPDPDTTIGELNQHHRSTEAALDEVELSSDTAAPARMVTLQPRRTIVYTAGIGAALAVLGVAGVLIITRTAAPPPAAAVRIVLPPRQLTLTQRDEQDFTTAYGRRPVPGAVPAAVVLVGYGGDRNRVKQLQAALDRAGALAEVPISTVTTGEMPPQGVELGSLIGTVYFNR